jgi:HlyD family secretion protein
MVVQQEEPHLYPSQFAADSAESLLTQYESRRPVIYWISMVIVIAALIALPIVKVDVTVQGSGKVRPITERASIVARAAGFVSELNVRDNDKVKKGDVILRLEFQAVQAKKVYHDRRWKQTTKEMADLQYLVGQVRNSAEVDPAQLQTAKYVSEFQSYSIALRDAEIKVEKALREYQRGLTLRNQNVISEKDLQDYKTALDEAETSRNTVTRNQLQQWYAGEVAKEADLDNLEAEKHQLAEEEELYSIVAPVDGTVIGLVGLTVGSYVRAAQELGEISPR